jgi:hypothetical protein
LSPVAPLGDRSHPTSPHPDPVDVWITDGTPPVGPT